jgi:hypothetical protein
MLFLIASIVFAMLIGLSAVMVFGPDQLPLWIEGLFSGVIGAGMVARAVEISLKEWRTRFARIYSCDYIKSEFINVNSATILSLANRYEGQHSPN